MTGYKISDYLRTAKLNETVFRNILRDLRDNPQERSYSEIIYIPFHNMSETRLDVDLPIEEIVKKYSEQYNESFFELANFTRPEKTKAFIFYNGHLRHKDISICLEYDINENDSVMFKRMVFRGISS